MSLISWSDWFKSIMSFAFLIGAIILFQYVGLDTNFLITFILAIFSIIISITFLIFSNSSYMEMNNLLKEVNLRIQGVEKKFEGYSEDPTISDKVEALTGGSKHE